MSGAGCWAWVTREPSGEDERRACGQQRVAHSQYAPPCGTLPASAGRAILQVELRALDTRDRAHDGAEALLNGADARGRLIAPALRTHDRAGEGHHPAAGLDRDRIRREIGRAEERASTRASSAASGEFGAAAEKVQALTAAPMPMIRGTQNVNATGLMG